MTSPVTLTIIGSNPTATQNAVISKDLTITASEAKTITISSNVRFDDKLTLGPNVTITGFNGALAEDATINGTLNGNATLNTVKSGKELTINADSSVSEANLRVLYGSTVTVNGKLDSGAASTSSSSTGAPLALSGSLYIGNRGNNTLNVKNATVSTTSLLGTNDGEYPGATIATGLYNDYGFTAPSLSNGTSSVILENSVLAFSGSVELGNTGSGDITLKNGSQLLGGSGATVTISSKNTMHMDYKSKITAKQFTNSGTLYVDVSGMTASEVIIVDTATDITDSSMGKVVIENNNGYGVVKSGQDIKLVKASASLTHGSNVTYTDLATALSIAADGDTITLLANDSTNRGISKKITLDLNGYTMSGAVNIRANTTIDDTYAGSKGKITGAVSVFGNSKLEIKNGTIKTLSTKADTASIAIVDGTVGGESGSILISEGSLSISGGKISNLTVGDVSNENTASLAVTGGEFTGTNTILAKYKSAAVTTTLTTVIANLTTPTGYVWLDKSGTSTLTTLQGAIDSATTGSTIKMGGDTTVSRLTIAKSIVLDLNGKTLQDDGSSVTTATSYLIGVENGGSLTVIDTASGGSISTTRDAAIRMAPTESRSSSPASLIVGSSTDTGSNYFKISGATNGIDGVETHENTAITVNGCSEIKGTAGTAGAGIANPQKNSSVTINGGVITGVKGLDIAQTSSGTGSGAITVKIAGGTVKTTGTYAISESDARRLKNVSLEISGGNIAGKIDVNSVTNFITGGKYTVDPSKDETTATNFLADGYKVDSITGPYPYQVNKDIPTYALTVTSNLTSAKLSPTSGTKYAAGKSVSLSASAAPNGYTFGGWYAGTTLISSSLTATYTMPSAATTVTARYLKNLTIKANDDTVATGSDYTGDKTKITITGADSGDTNIVNTANMTMTAATYKKDTSAVGSKHDIVVAGATLNSAFATKYTITTYTKGTLTVIEGTGPEAFIADVEKLPAATAVTVDNLEATKAAVETAKADYSKLSTTAKDLADVKAAKEKLDAVEAAVTKLEADKAAADAVTEKIAALPAADKATSADREALDKAKAAFDALTADQKKLVPEADQTKLAEVEKAVEAAEKADIEAADKVTKMINALPAPEDATKEDREAVDKAKAALAALTPAQQKLVPQTAKDRLEAVDEAVKKKEGGDEDQKAADACMEKIEAIKKQPAGKGKAATEEARAAYDALTDAQKALLPKSAEELLVAAEEAYTKDRTFQCGDAMYKVLPSGNVSYNRPADTKCTSAVVPNQIKKNGYLYKVVKVSIGAFKNCESLNWVVINKNVGAIGKYAFKNTPSLSKINIKSRTLKTGKVVSAFAAGGKSNGAKLLVKTPSSYVSSYTSLFKGEGLLNQKAKVQAA